MNFQWNNVIVDYDARTQRVGNQLDMHNADGMLKGAIIELLRTVYNSEYPMRHISLEITLTD